MIAALREIRDAIRRQGGSATVKVTKDTLETVSVNEAAKLLHTRPSAVDRLIAHRRLVCVNLGERRIPLWSVLALQESGIDLSEAS